MKGDLRIGRLVVSRRRRNPFSLAEAINLDHPRRDGTAHGLPEETCGKPRREKQRTKRHQTPIFGLDARRPDTLVPDLSCLLVRRFRFGRTAVTNGGAFEHQGSPSERLTEEPPPP